MKGEFEWAEVPYPESIQGTAEKVESRSDPIAVLWVPDIDARHKWREYNVDRPTSKPGRSTGFRKPGER